MNPGKVIRKKVIQTLIHLLFCILLIGCRAPVSHSSKEYPAVKISAELSTGEDQALEAIIKPYRDPLIKSMNEVMVTSDSQAVKALPESSLGNLVCDMLVQYVKEEKGLQADFCFLNTGGLRIELPKGEITRSMLYELMPFENLLVIAKLDGVELRLLLDQIAQRGGGPVSGLKMGIRNGAPDQALIAGKSIDPSKIYNVLTSDYLFNGGDKYVLPQKAEVDITNILLRDALLEKFRLIKQTGKVIQPRTDGRIYLVTP